MPSIWAPQATRKCARSCTCGSLAALRRIVVPAAATAAMRAFSVAVTLGSSRKMSAPRSVFASSWYVAPTVISVPNRSSARKWVSTRRRPITSPPGGGRFTRPNRASIGPASRMDARIRAESLGSSSRGSAAAVFTSTEFGAVHATAAPKWASSSSMVSTSRMWGTLSMRQGPSASRVAARMGSAAFLFPAGRIVPFSGRPPETRNDGGIGDRKLRRGLRARQACANVRRVNPVLALGLLAVAGLLAARLPRPSSPRPPPLDLAITAGVPLILLGLVLGPGIELLARPLLRAIAPLTAFAIGWIGALLGARFEWRYARRIPRGAWLLAAAGAGAAFLAVALGAWLLTRLVPGLAAGWAPRLPAVLAIAAVAAASGPAAVTAVAQAVGVERRLTRALGRAATLETACAALAMGAPLALRHPLSWAVFAVGGGALVGVVCASAARLIPVNEDVTPAVVGSVLFGAGIGYATDVSAFMVCALAGLVAVNASPRRRDVRAALRASQRPIYALVLIISGALLALPTLWILAAVLLLQALRIGARWLSGRYARAALTPRDLPPHVGLGTVAQGGAALALALNYFLMYGGR